MASVKESTRYFPRAIVIGLALITVLILTSCAPEDTTVKPPGLSPGTWQEERLSTSANSVDTKIFQQQTDSKGSSDDTVSETESDVKDSGSTPQLAEENIRGRGPIETQKTQSLPTDFPTGLLPDALKNNIYDAGAWSNSEWFVVLSFKTIDEANSSVELIIEHSGLKQINRENLDDGGYLWDLSSTDFEVSVLTMLDQNYKPLASIEIEQIN